MKVVFTLLLACVIGVGVAAAQSSLPRSIGGGILNGKATSLPKPEYPEGARLAGIGGTVGVDVVIDETGRVIAAMADLNDQREAYDANGEKLPAVPVDALLRQSAENAARMAKFSPTLLSGIPVRVSGRIVYNFVAKDEAKVSHSDDPGSGPVMNGEAFSLPSPAYPAAARAVKAQGEVMVRVEIDAAGNVTSATAASGHPLLRSAAQQAAREAKFRPVAEGSAPRSGVLVYNF